MKNTKADQKVSFLHSVNALLFFVSKAIKGLLEEGYTDYTPELVEIESESQMGLVCRIKRTMKLNKYVTLPLIFSIIFISFYFKTASAGGSLTLDEIIPLVSQSKKLKQEVETALQEIGSEESDIICFGTRLGRHFGSLGGARIAPFACRFGNYRILTIEAANRIELPDGGLSTPEDLLKQQSIPEELSLSFCLTSWTWEDERNEEKINAH